MYMRAVRLLAYHYHKSPDKTSEEELRQYFLHLKNVKQWSRVSMTIAICGIKFFYEHTLKQKWATFNIVRPAPDKRLPTILSRDEVRLILNKVRLLRYRVCLATIYSCGLRLREGTELKVADIDSSRMMIHLRHAKGGKVRNEPQCFISSSYPLRPSDKRADICLSQRGPLRYRRSFLKYPTA